MAGLKIGFSRIGLMCAVTIFVAGFLAGLLAERVTAAGPLLGKPIADVRGASNLQVGTVEELEAHERSVGGRLPWRQQSPAGSEVADQFVAPAFAAGPEPTPTLAPYPTAMAVPALPRMPTVDPSGVSMQPGPLAKIDAAVQRSLDQALFPGAVVLVARSGGVVKQNAYGYATLYSRPGERLADPTPAKANTIYDLASISKLFTTVATMKLVEQGAVDLDAPVARYIPEFGLNDKSSVTVRHLLSHSSGLPEGMQLLKHGSTRRERLDVVFAARLKHPPGSTRLYSDVGFITLGALVERVSGVSLDQFVAREILNPLQMSDTMYNPPSDLMPRIAATEWEPAVGRGMVRGRVHDNDAFSLDGVAGNAGVFSTAQDLAVFAQMILNGGQYAGVRVLSENTVNSMFVLQSKSPNGETSSLGWDLDQGWYMGSLASGRAVGHTGYTGTSLVIDRASQTITIVLTNRVHPLAKTSVNATRKDVANAVSESLR